MWKQVEHLADTAPDDENGFNLVLQELDRVYQYDSRVEMPKAFERFFYGVNRPAEQRQLVMSQVDNKKLSVNTVEQALFYLFGQDYKSTRTEGPPQQRKRENLPAEQMGQLQNVWRRLRHGGGRELSRTRRSMRYVDDTADPVYYKEENELYEEEDYEPNEFEYYDPTYFGEDEEDEPVEEAYAAYLDARRHLAEVEGRPWLLPWRGYDRQRHPTSCRCPGRKWKGKTSQGQVEGQASWKKESW